MDPCDLNFANFEVFKYLYELLVLKNETLLASTISPKLFNGVVLKARIGK